MRILKKEFRQCACCMETHEVALVRFQTYMTFKGEKVEYEAVAEYCELADEYYTSGDMLNENDMAMKNAYRKKMGLLTTDEIANIRKKYAITQSDLALALNWGGKTITRYESHQVQDAAHDAILKKIDSDPEWFLTLLERQERHLPVNVYAKYQQKVTELFGQSEDDYLRKSIRAQYAKYDKDVNCCGGKRLDIDKLVEVMCYFANAYKMQYLYKVKMMKLLWYADMLSYKRRGVPMTGLVYQSMPMGALPIAHKSILNLKGLSIEEIEHGNSTGYRFLRAENKEYTMLTKEDKDILDVIIRQFAENTKEEIVDYMHKEKAYIETPSGNIISYKYAAELSLD